MRFEGVDGLRALAALIVAFGHCYRTGIIGNFLQPIADTPLAIVIAGDAAVLLFFIMSGFFLALPFSQGKRQGYFDFLIKRYIRIYIPYIAAVFGAVICFELFQKSGGIAGMSAWFNVLWQSPPTFDMILLHVIMLGQFDANIYDPVLWAMVIEMRMAFIAPFAILFVYRFGATVSILVALAISYCSFICYEKFDLSDMGTAYWRSFALITPFIIGMAIAFNKDKLLALADKTPKSISFVLLAICISLMSCAYWLNVGIGTFKHYTILSFCSAVILVFGLYGGRFSAIIGNKVLAYIGGVSYSLYLWHFILLLSLIYCFYGVIPNIVIFTIWVLAIVPLAKLTYKLIEEPSMQLAKRIKLSK